MKACTSRAGETRTRHELGGRTRRTRCADAAGVHAEAVGARASNRHARADARTGVPSLRVSVRVAHEGVHSGHKVRESDVSVFIAGMAAGVIVTLWAQSLWGSGND